METVSIFDLYEWNSLVSGTYNRVYDFQQQDNCKGKGLEYFSVPGEDNDYDNESVLEIVNGPEMGVKFSSWLARDTAQLLEASNSMSPDLELDLWWRRNFYPSLQSIANDLYKKGILSEGDYAININW